MAKVIQLKDNTYLYGTIIEKGNNSNGNYIKFSDGTLICHSTKKILLQLSRSWGGVLYENQTAGQLGNYPHNFASTPTVICTVGNTRGIFVELIRNTSNTSYGEVFLARPSADDQEYNYELKLLAIGKWK